MNFSKIIGYQSIKEKLCKAFTQSKRPQAPLISGPQGSPVLPFAIALATYLHCPNRQATDACKSCTSCKKIGKYLHPDLLFAFPLGSSAKKTAQRGSPTAAAMPSWRAFLTHNPYENLQGWSAHLGDHAKQMHINNAQIEEIITFLRTHPLESRYKSVILWLPEHLYPSAAGKLLKTLEEPPKNTFLILASHQRSHIIPTIASRTWPLSIPPFQDSDLVQALSIQYPHIPIEKREEAAYAASGNILLAYQQATQEDTPHFTLLSHWLRSLYAQQWEQTLESAEKFSKSTPNEQKTWLLHALHLLRNTVLLQQGEGQAKVTHATVHTFCQKLGATLSLQKLAYIVHTLEGMYTKLSRNAHPKLLFMASSLAIAQAIQPT